jgi:hypothetical protein
MLDRLGIGCRLGVVLALGGGVTEVWFYGAADVAIAYRR